MENVDPDEEKLPDAQRKPTTTEVTVVQEPQRRLSNENNESSQDHGEKMSTATGSVDSTTTSENASVDSTTAPETASLDSTTAPETASVDSPTTSENASVDSTTAPETASLDSTTAPETASTSLATAPETGTDTSLQTNQSSGGTATGELAEKAYSADALHSIKTPGLGTKPLVGKISENAIGDVAASEKGPNPDALNSIKTPVLGAKPPAGKISENAIGEVAASEKGSNPDAFNSIKTPVLGAKLPAEKTPSEQVAAPSAPVADKSSNKTMPPPPVANQFSKSVLDSVKTPVKKPIVDPIVQARINKNRQAEAEAKALEALEAFTGRRPVDRSDVQPMSEEETKKQQELRQSVRKKAIIKDPTALNFVRRHNMALVISSFVLIIGICGYVMHNDSMQKSLLDETKKQLQERRFEEAKKSAEQGLRDYPNEVFFRIYHAEALANLGNVESALSEIKLASKVRPDDMEVVAYRAKVFTEIGELQLALADYKRLVADRKTASNLAGKAAVELLLQDAQNALADINAAFKLEPHDRSLFAGRAMAYAGSGVGDYQKAIADWTTLLKNSPGDEIAYAERAHAEFQEKQTDKALADLSRSIKLKPTAQAYYYRGLIHQDQKQTAQAINDFSTGLKYAENATHNGNEIVPAEGVFKVKSTDAPFLFWARADAEMSTGKYKEASEDFSKAIKKIPENLILRQKRGACYEKIGDYADAYDDYAFLIQNNPLPEWYLRRGSALAKQGQYNRANFDFAKAIALKPKYVEAYMARGTAFCDQNIFANAAEDFNTVLKLDPANLEAKQMLALVSKRKRSAIQNTMPGGPAEWKLSQELLQKDPLNAAYQLMQHGDAPGAIPILIDLIKKDPSNLQARRYLAWDCSDQLKAQMAIEQFKILEQYNQLRPVDFAKYAFALEQAGSKSAPSVYMRAIAANPGDIKLRIGLCRTCVDLDNFNLLEIGAYQGLHVATNEQDREKFRDYLTFAHEKKAKKQ